MSAFDWQPIPQEDLDETDREVSEQVGACPICGGPADGTVCGPFCEGRDGPAELSTLEGGKQEGVWY